MNPNTLTITLWSVIAIAGLVSVVVQATHMCRAAVRRKRLRESMQFAGAAAGFAAAAMLAFAQATSTLANVQRAFGEQVRAAELAHRERD